MEQEEINPGDYVECVNESDSKEVKLGEYYLVDNKLSTMNGINFCSIVNDQGVSVLLAKSRFKKIDPFQYVMRQVEKNYEKIKNDSIK